MIQEDREARLFWGGPRPNSGIHYRLENSGAVAGVDLVLTVWGRKLCSGRWPRGWEMSWFPCRCD